MRICWCTIFVSDMEASVEFYRDFVGLPLQKRYIAGNGDDTAFLGDESHAQIELICTGRGVNHEGDSVSVGFEVDSVDRMLERVEAAGIPVLAGPVRTNPRIHYLVVSDPSGCPVTFAQRLPGTEAGL